MDNGESGFLARLQAMEEQISLLQREVDDLRSGGGRSMRHALQCPGCGCRKLLHATEVLDRSDEGRKKLALAQPSVWSSAGAGEFEVFVCTGCKMAEWYVTDLRSLEVDGQTIRLIDGDTAPVRAAGPYR
jgi:hypothetical protein